MYVSKADTMPVCIRRKGESLRFGPGPRSAAGCLLLDIAPLRQPMEIFLIKTLQTRDIGKASHVKKHLRPDA
jgi:hypothetical protein